MPDIISARKPPKGLLFARIEIFVEMIRGHICDGGALPLGGIVGGLPSVTVYSSFMDYYISGLTAGATIEPEPR